MRLLSRLLLACLALPAACGTARDGAQIVTPWDIGHPSQSLPAVAAGETRLVLSDGQVTLCLDGPGHATVDRITPTIRSGSMKVEGFAVVLTRDAAKTTRLAPGPAVIDHACPRSGRRATAEELATMVYLQLKVRQLARTSTVADSFVLDYTSEGRRHSYTLPWELVLCAPEDTTTKLCASPG